MPLDGALRHYSPPESLDNGLWLPPGGDEVANRPLRDPTLWCLVIFLATVVAFGLLRNDKRFAGAPKWYWMEKLVWPQDADVVILGDSRTYRGVNPDPFTRDGVARNFGFSSAKFTQRFLSRAAALLHPDGRRVLVLGMTLFSVQVVEDQQDGFTEAEREYSRLRLPLWLARTVAEWELAVEPIALDAGRLLPPGLTSLPTKSARALTSDYLQVFHDNGWVESDRTLEDPVVKGLANVRESFSDRHLAAADLTVLMNSVREFVASGICVCAFRPPVPPEVAALEDSLGFLDYKALAADLESAGATWIDIDTSDLRSYDGSHLDGPSARALSEQLARAVAQTCASK